VSIHREAFSDLLNKFSLITLELSRLNALMVYYSDCGNNSKLSATIDTIKRLEMSKSTIAIELDKRIPINTNDSKNHRPDEDEFRTSV